MGSVWSYVEVRLDRTLSMDRFRLTPLQRYFENLGTNFDVARNTTNIVSYEF